MAVSVVAHPAKIINTYDFAKPILGVLTALAEVGYCRGIMEAVGVKAQDKVICAI